MTLFLPCLHGAGAQVAFSSPMKATGPSGDSQSLHYNRIRVCSKVYLLRSGKGAIGDHLRQGGAPRAPTGYPSGATVAIGEDHKTLARSLRLRKDAGFRDIVRRPLKLYKSDQVAHQPIPHLRSYLKRSHSLRQVRVKMIAASRTYGQECRRPS